MTIEVNMSFDNLSSFVRDLTFDLGNGSFWYIVIMIRLLRVGPQAVFYGDLNQEDSEVFLVQIEKSSFMGS